LAAIVGVFALLPAAASAADESVYVLDTSWDPPALTIDPGDTVTWHVDSQRDGTRVSGHDVLVCEGKDNPDIFEEVTCGFDTSDPEAVPPPNYIGHRPYCGYFDGVPEGECEDGLPSDLSLTFDTPGDYVYYCQVHGPMRGSITVTGGEVPAPKLKISISPKKKNVKQGKSVTFKVKVKNNGDGDATGVKVCASGPKKKVKLPKCKKLNTIAGGKTKTASMKVKVKKGKKAKGSAKVKFKVTVGNAPNKTVKGTVKIKK